MDRYNTMELDITNAPRLKNQITAVRLYK